jgi:O-antigen/teichoic acid export membrane protein
MLGTGAAQFFPILFLPVISRLYQPKDYGEYALFASIVGILIIFVTSHYSQAIMLPEDNHDAKKLLDISFTINVLFSFVVLFISLCYSLIFHNYIYLLLSVAIFSSGMIAILSIWANRNGKYKVLSTSRVLLGFSVVSLQIGLSFFLKNTGLIISLVLSQMLVAFFLLQRTEKMKINIIGYKKSKLLLLRYKYFAYYNMPSTLNNSLAVQLPTFLMTYFAGPVPTGYFNFSNRTLGVPLSLLSSSIGEVFRQSAVEARHKTGNCKKIFMKTFILLSSLSLPVLGIIWIFAPRIFEFIFGNEWYIAGRYVQILAPLFLIRFIVSPLSYMLIATEKLGKNFMIQLLKVILSTLGLLCGVFFWRTPEAMLFLYMAGYSTIYLYEFYCSYIYSR